MLLWPSDIPQARGRRFSPNPMPRTPDTGWKLINEFPSLKHAKVISFDLETKDPEIKKFGPGWGRGRGYIIGVAVGTADGFRRYYPIRHENGPNCDPQQVFGWLNEELSRPHQPKCAHNALYDLGWLEFEGVHVVGNTYCTWTAEKLLNHSAEASLEECGQRYLGEGKVSEGLYDWAWQAWGRGKAKSDQEKRELAMANLWRVPPSLVGFYAESDVDLPLRIGPKQFDRLHELGMWDLYQMECDLIPLLVQMRLAGVSVDLEAANRAHDAFGDTIIEVQTKVDEIAGKPLNTGSALEIAPVFDTLGISYPRTKKTGAPSFKGEFLTTVDHPLAALIVELEELKKFQSTFIQGQIFDANANGKVYCSFNPLRAVTGRMSCSTPNLQQTPSRSKLAKVVRSIFEPDANHEEWRSYDYSSVESRILAHFAVGQGAAALRKEYRNDPDTDYHKWTIGTVKTTTGIALERKPAKIISFGLGYGASLKKLASMLGLTLEQAEPLFEAYHGGLPFVKATMDSMSREAEEFGYTTTVLGRRASFDYWEPVYSPRGAERPVALLFDNALRFYGPNIKRSHLHKALNYKIQGTAADFMKAAMVKCYKEGVFDVIGVPRLVIHDSLEFSVATRSKAIDRAFQEMRHTMETALKFRVPMRVEGNRGPSWGEANIKIER